MNLAEYYINAVKSGEIVSNRYVKRAIERHLSDLKISKKKNYPYQFDKHKGERAIKIARLHRHTAGALANNPFDLQPFQAFILYALFGWVRKDTGFRRYTKAYIEMARKGGKSEFAAIIANIGLLFDDEFGSEVYTAATKRDQARIVFDRSHYMLRTLSKDSSYVGSKVRTLKYNINVPSTNSKMEALASDSKSMDGLLPHFCIVDEYHAHRDNSLVKVLETGMNSRRQPLLFMITTAGFNIDGPCYAFREVCIDMLSGRIEHDSLFAMIYTLDEGDEWQDEEVWIKANPNLGKTPTLIAMRNALKSAQTEGAYAEVEFKTKNLNVWTSTSATWISDDIWQKCGDPIDPDALKNRACYGGLDLGSVSDLTAYTLFFPGTDEDPIHRTLHFFWVPEEDLDKKSRDQRVDYRQWITDGEVITTPGNATDYQFVRQFITGLSDKYRIMATGYDRWNKLSIIPDLTNDGMNLYPFGQGFGSMSAPCKALNIMVLNKEINHGGNKVMRWMMSNVTLAFNPAGDIKIDKSKSRQKVDGPVSLAMAIGTWQAMKIEEQKDQSVYKRKDILFA